jgi:uncharacterized membrane protein YedE/YeeE
MTEFTPYAGLLGGAVIGLAAFLLLWINGNIAGISGIVGNLLNTRESNNLWRWSFVLGLIIGPLLAENWDYSLPTDIDLSWPLVLIGGALVGLGSRLGSGCTSGHGICGIGRLSQRSIIATIVFMLVAIVAVFITQHVIGALV